MKLQEKDYNRLKEFMQHKYGINLSNKQSLIEGRLSPILTKKGFGSYSDYIDYALNDKSGKEVLTLISRLTTNFTYFMREQQHYDLLAEQVLPECTARIRDKDFRTWSAGCSSGEEAYTAAMVINEYFGNKKAGWDTTILATDISDKVLSKGKNGIYPSESLDRLPQGWVEKYFDQIDDEQYAVKPMLRKEVTFGKFNLMDKKLPFRRKFHVIFCRNVMIYFDMQTRMELSQRFFNALEPGGYLFIGLSETMIAKNSFEYVRPSVYRKRV